MSVVGEYRRILADLIAMLAGSSSPAARRFGEALGGAQLEHAPHVSAAAARALAILEDTPLSDTDLDNAIERERIEDQLEHFAALCRVVLGH